MSRNNKMKNKKSKLQHYICLGCFKVHKGDTIFGGDYCSGKCYDTVKNKLIDRLRFRYNLTKIDIHDIINELRRYKIA